MTKCFYCHGPDATREYMGQMFCSGECISLVDEDELVLAGSMTEEEYETLQDKEPLYDMDGGYYHPPYQGGCV